MVSTSVRDPAMWQPLSRFGGRARARARGTSTYGSIRPKTITPVKRKRAQLFRYDSSSDTEDEEPPRPEAKRPRHTRGVMDEELLHLAQLGESDLNEARDVGKEETEGGEFESPDVESVAMSGIDGDDEEYTVENPRSGRAEFDDYFVSPESRVVHHDFPWEDALSAVEIQQMFDIQEYIDSLPHILKRRVRTDLAESRPKGRFDESLRVTLLAKQFKRRIRSGRLTPSELLELAAQRPPYSTRADFHTPTPELSSEEDVSESWDSADFEEEDSSAPERPPTPMPPSDSDSDSDSDDDEPPVYSSMEISQHLGRREMEMMGIYSDEE